MLRNPISAEIGKELVKMDFYVLKNDEEDGWILVEYRHTLSFEEKDDIGGYRFQLCRDR